MTLCDRTTLIALMCWTLGAPTLVGCGGPSNRGSVSGVVTLDGKLIDNGVISFVPADGNQGPTAGSTITNGRYEINREKGAAIGANRVSITSLQKTGRKIPSLGAEFDELADIVPHEYNAESTLMRNVEPGVNELNFELQGRVPIEADSRKSPGSR